MAEFLIPNYKVDDLRNKVNKIANKGAEVTFNILDDSVDVSAPELGPNASIKCSRIDIEGEYKIEGWKFVATIEHASPENIIRLADYSFEGRIPERYRTSGRECEHCHLSRDRNDTYLVYNEDEDEFKQVGKTCLRNYTNGLNAATCAELASVMYEIDKISSATDLNNLDYDFLRSDFGRNYISYPMKTATKKAFKYVLNNGYESGKTGKEFSRKFLDGELSEEASDSEIESVTNWLQSLDTSDWQRNALAAWTKDDFQSRDGGLITSAVSIYLRDKEREEQRQRMLNSESNAYAGEVGDKVTFTVSEVRVAYVRSGGYSYYSNDYPVYRIKGTDNKIYLWGCTTGIEINVGDTFEGKIKKLIERNNGEKQTEVTRCKKISEAPQYRGIFH